jgi:hypothetical protein
VQYALDSVAALRQAGLAAAMGYTDADGIALIQMIAGGAPMAEDLAEGCLRYRMVRWHVGLVLWIDDPQQADVQDEAIAAVRSAAGGQSALVARASATSRWIWLSGEDVPDLHHVEKALATTGEVRVAVGRPGRGLEGFRSSRQDALAAQALVIRLGSDRRFTPYADVELIDALTKDVPAHVGPSTTPSARWPKQTQHCAKPFSLTCSAASTPPGRPPTSTRTATPSSGAFHVPTSCQRSRWRRTRPTWRRRSCFWTSRLTS